MANPLTLPSLPQIDPNLILPVLLFVVPGFILYTVFAAYMPRTSKDPSARILHFLSLACLNLALWFPILFPLSHTPWVQTHPQIAGALAVLLVALVSPAVLGVLIGRSMSAGQRNWFWKLVGIHPLGLSKSAWDYKFTVIGQNKRPDFVTIFLTDNHVLGGIYSKEAFASHDERDIALLWQYHYAGDGTWLPIEGNQGVWIRGDQILQVTFWDCPSLENGRPAYVKAPISKYFPPGSRTETRP